MSDPAAIPEMPAPAAPQPPAPPPEPSPEPPLELELELPPEVLPQLLRHPALADCPGLRARGTAGDCVWLDSAEGRLARLGQTVEAPGKGPRRHLLVLPPPGFSPPGAAPVLLAEDVVGAAPGSTDGEVLLPLAAFEGRRVEAECGGVRLVLRHGNLRCVAAEAPVARLVLSGPAAEVLSLGSALARDLPVLPAVAGLAETARALSRQERPRPRRQGPPDLHTAETVEEALSLAIAHLTEVLLAQSSRLLPEDSHEGVHQSRVATRRLRSCLKQFRPALDGTALRALDAMLRDLAQAMGEARDLDVFLMNLGAELEAAIGPDDRRLGALLRKARARRQAAYAALREMLTGPGFRQLIWAAARLSVLREWGSDAPPDHDTKLRPFAAATLSRRWRRLRRRGEKIESLDAEGLHELRLEAKRLRYAAELFAPLWPGKTSRRFIKRLSAVQEALGLANDTHVARALVAGLAGRHGAGSWAIGLAEGFALAKGAGARSKALAAWGRMQGISRFWDS
ncbi:CYTH and CHAD domain-containing protein [Roseomonas marmotae]|uniref:CHAD domain-containing protein n=1 Tax=Roseomonas marmotae TaxID=2768161 RepID=A0ABS3K9W9_9PROT|nr:CHAD domain-containing protein [Roseomonas marmotae]MBO1074258.1 CHAD domain-containing protein [Roseomonas marmotae]QTI78012.1 CHAD domain-containing protein [Roseomonas marmotae]